MEEEYFVIVFPEGRSLLLLQDQFALVIIFILICQTPI